MTTKLSDGMEKFLAHFERIALATEQYAVTGSAASEDAKKIRNAAALIRAQAMVIEAQKALLVFDENNYNEQMRYGTLLVESEEAKAALAKLLESEWS